MIEIDQMTNSRYGKQFPISLVMTQLQTIARFCEISKITEPRNDVPHSRQPNCRAKKYEIYLIPINAGSGGARHASNDKGDTLV